EGEGHPGHLHRLPRRGPRLRPPAEQHRLQRGGGKLPRQMPRRPGGADRPVAQGVNGGGPVRRRICAGAFRGDEVNSSPSERWGGGPRETGWRGRRRGSGGFTREPLTSATPTPPPHFVRSPSPRAGARGEDFTLHNTLRSAIGAAVEPRPAPQPAAAAGANRFGGLECPADARSTKARPRSSTRVRSPAL